MCLVGCSGERAPENNKEQFVSLLLDPDAFSSLVELSTNIFGVSLEKPHLTLYSGVWGSML